MIKRVLLSVGLTLTSAVLFFWGTGAPESYIGSQPGLILATQVVPEDPPPPQSVCCTMNVPPTSPQCIPGVYWDIFSQTCRRVPRAPFVPGY
jgi:hypothetical protein